MRTISGWTGKLGAALVLLVCGVVAWAVDDDVKRGEYLARAGDCISCHTDATGTPYAGGLPVHTPFGTTKHLFAQFNDIEKRGWLWLSATK